MEDNLIEGECYDLTEIIAVIIAKNRLILFVMVHYNYDKRMGS